MLERHYTAAELSKILGVDARTIKSAVNRGELLGKKIGSIVVIPESSVTDYQNGQDSRQVRLLKEQVRELETTLERYKALMQSVGAELIKEAQDWKP